MNIIPSAIRIEFQKLQEQQKPLQARKQDVPKVTRAVNQDLTEISNQIRSLKAQKNEYQADVRSYAITAAAYDRAERNFSERIAYLGNVEDKPLRLKGDRIKLMEYRGWNIFKRGSERPAYAEQAKALHDHYKLPVGIGTDAVAIREHLISTRDAATASHELFTVKIHAAENALAPLREQRTEMKAKRLSVLDTELPTWRDDQRELDNMTRRLSQLSDKLRGRPEYPVKWGDFAAIWSTNAGCRSIQRSLKEKTAYKINNREVIRELNARHDYDLGTKRGREKTDDITFASSQLSSYQTLDDQCQKIYQRALAPVENGTGMPKSARAYRVANLSALSSARIRLALETHGALIKPSALLACSKTEQGAVDFENGLGQRRNTLFIIKGCSQMPTAGALVVASEQESIFSPYALFKVENIEKKDGRDVITLAEQLTSMNHQARTTAYELDL